MSWQNNDSEDSDDSSDEDYPVFQSLTAVVIDNSDSMFVLDDDEESCPFQICLEALYNTLDKYVFGQWKNKISMHVLDGRDHGAVFELSSDLLGAMQKLAELMKKSTDELSTTFCSRGITDNVLYETFSDACDFLRKTGYDNTIKNIIVLTNDPNCSNCNANNDDLERVMDKMLSCNIDLAVIPLINDFNWNKFYRTLLNKKMADTLIDEIPREGYQNVNSLVQVLDRFIHPKRNVQFLKFLYGPGDSPEYMPLQVRFI